MKGLPSRPHGRTHWLFLPILLFGVLIVHFGLLAAHGLPAHAAMMSPAAASVSEGGSDTQAVQSSEKDGQADAAIFTQPGGDHHHGGHDGPYCHEAPEYAWAATSPPLPERPDVGLWLLAAAGLVVPVPLLSWLRSYHGWWSSSPPWRPAGVELLTRTCVSRT